MKTVKIISAISAMLLFTSCGINTAYVLNSNQNSTQVHLRENNYKIIGRVSGSSEVSYIFMIGGMSKKQLYEDAYSAMMKDADLTSGSRAIINNFTEEQFSGFFPFAYTRRVTVSASMIEFIK